MKASICIATYNKPVHLGKVLESIYAQSPGFEFETIVVDDGSPRRLDRVCQPYPARYVRLDRRSAYGNPSHARNVAYKLAKGEVIIAQSDEVLHHSDGCIQRLVDELKPGRFVIATVFNVDYIGQRCRDSAGNYEYTSPRLQRPLFFLGSLYREDLYAVGGNDEEFIGPGYDDDWFALCLTRGRGLEPYYSQDITGHHQCHAQYEYADFLRSRQIYQHKCRQAEAGATLWHASGGPWNMEPDESVVELDQRG